MIARLVDCIKRNCGPASAHSLAISRATLLLPFVFATALSSAALAQTIWVPGLVIEKTAVRIEPDPARTPLATLAPGTSVTVVSVEQGWLEIAFEDQRYGRRVGYVPRSTVNFTIPAAARPVAAAKPPEPVTPPPARAAVRPVEDQVASAVPSSAPAKPAAPITRPPVRTVEDEFLSSVKLSAPATQPPARAAVSSVEEAFPAVTSSLSVVKPSAPGTESPARAAVSSVEEAFPAVTSSPAVKPAEAVTQPSASAAVVSLEDAGRVSIASDDLPTPHSSASPEAAAFSAPIVAGASRADRAPVSPKRGMLVTVMIPRALLKENGYLTVGTVPIVAADITSAGSNGALVSGLKDWMLAGLPSMLEASVKKITRKKEYTELELRATDVVMKLRFAASVAEPEILGQLIAEGQRDTPVALKYRDEAHAALTGVFPGDLNRLPDERKLSILATLQGAAGDIHLHEGRVYASFDLNADDTVFNDRTADQETIVAHVLNETVLAAVRDMSKSLADVPELHGMRVQYRIPHKSKLGASTKEYRLELLADAEHVINFSRAELTNQEFIDASTVLVDGNPVRIALVAPANEPSSGQVKPDAP